MGAPRPVAPRGPPSAATPTQIGAFRVERPVGAGSMGMIYEGRDPDGQRVAIKLMRGGLGETGRVRFQREARLLADLDHPAIVACREHGFLADGRPYLVMEWLAGEDLATRLRRGPLTIDETVDLAVRIASALAAVHAHGVVHRDLKPGNIFLVDGLVAHATLLDFGVAHAEASTQVTQVGDLIGTLGYMAPEQARGEVTIDGRADLFSLACVLYECLAGHPAFPGGDPIAVLARLLIDSPPALRSLRPEVPQGLEHLIVDMLDKQPDGRPSSAQSVVDRLAGLGDAAGLGAGPPSITSVERRLFVVLFARLPEELGLAATLPAEQTTSSQILANFLALASPFHVHFSPLLGGTLLLSGDGGGSPGDDAALLARRALALRAAFPGIALAMAAGHGTRSHHALAGQVLDAAAALLARTLTDAIALDEVTADLLAQRFIVDDDSDLLQLAGERDTPATRTVLGRSTPFVGRARELGVVLSAFATVLHAGLGALVLVTADAGLGKSRLCHEALVAIQHQRPDVLVLAAHGTPLGETTSLGAIARVLRRIPGDEDRPLAARIVARIAGLLPDDEAVATADALASLAAVLADDPHALAHIADAGRLAWLRWLELESACQPVILALDDLHCWDHASLEFVLAALEQSREQPAPLLVLAAARTEARERAPRIYNSPGAVHLDLTPLYARASERLIREFLPHTDSAVVDSLVQRAQGNAYFLEELIRAAVTGADGEAPPGVLATVQARLGRLGEVDRRLLRAASVFGPTFTDAGVAVVADAALDEVRPRLAALEGMELIVRQHVTSSAHRVYDFRHALTHEAAHATLTDDDRARGHLVAAEWLETQPAPDYGVIASHFLHARAHARARRWFLRAAEHAAELGHFDDALRCADRCVELGVHGVDLGLACLVQAEVHAWDGTLTDSFERAQQAAALLPAGTTPHFRALALSLQVATLRHDLTDVRARVREALHREPSPGGESGWMRFMCEAAHTAVSVGATAESAAIMARLDRGTAGRTLPDAAVAAIQRTRCALATYAWEFEAAIDLSRQAAERFTALGNLRGAGWSQLGVAQALHFAGAFAEAEPIMRSVGVLAAKLDAALLLVYQLSRLGTVCLQTGRLDEAHDVITRGLQISVSRGNSRGVGVGKTALAWYWLERGDPEQAEPLARAAIAELGLQRAFMRASQGFLCRTLLAQGRIDEADALADEFEPDITVNIVDFEAEHLQTLVAVRSAARGPAAGLSQLQRAVDHFAAIAGKLRSPGLRRDYLAQRPIRELLALAARHRLIGADLVA